MVKYSFKSPLKEWEGDQWVSCDLKNKIINTDLKQLSKHQYLFNTIVSGYIAYLDVLLIYVSIEKREKQGGGGEGVNNFSGFLFNTFVLRFSRDSPHISILSTLVSRLCSTGVKWHLLKFWFIVNLFVFFKIKLTNYF